MFGRLWSSLSTLTTESKGATDEMLNIFLKNRLKSWHDNVSSLTKANNRYRRSLENGLTTDREGKCNHRDIAKLYFVISAFKKTLSSSS